MIFLILFIALVLRLINLNQSLWLDEGINVNIVRSIDLKTIVSDYALGDFHPPLFHLVLKGWIEIFGSSEISVRMPSVIFGVLTVLFTYLIGKKLYDEKIGLIGATLMATAPLHIFYSQEARMYSMAAFFVSVSVYYFLCVLSKDKLFNWIGFIVATVLFLYGDYLPYLMIPVFLIFLTINRKKIERGWLTSFLPSAFLILIFMVPWFLIFPNQLKVGLAASSLSPSWSSVVGAAEPKNLLITFVKLTIGRISNDNNLVYALLFAPVGAFVSLLFLISLFRLSSQRIFLWIWLLCPILFGFILAYFVPVFAYFRFLFVLPAFYLIIASAINTLNWVFLTRLLLIVMLLVNLVSTCIYFLNDKFQREDWRTATEFVVGNSSTNSVVLFESAYTFGPFDYYNKGRVSAYGALEGFSSERSNVDNKVGQLVAQKDRVFLFQYLSGITDPGGFVFQTLTTEGFANVGTKDFHGVGFVYEFRR